MTSENKQLPSAAEIDKKIQEIKKAAVSEKTKDLVHKIIDPQTLVKKLKGTTVPYIGGVSHSTYVVPGQDFNEGVVVVNPSSSKITKLYVMSWVGTGFADPDMVSFLSDTDRQFPKIIMPDSKTFFWPASSDPTSDGLILKPGETKQMFRSFLVPAGTEETKYPLNICLIQCEYFHGASPIFDRAVIMINVCKSKPKDA